MTTRKLSKTFLEALKSGELSGFLTAVKKDDTLCLEIRDDYVNIYYRGGNMFKIMPSANMSKYDIFFDKNYCDKKVGFIEQINKSDYTKWIDNIPVLKSEMDAWFSKNPKSEREFQQLILRENNSGARAGGTDYFIVDIEYADSGNKSRFDMIALKWLSTGAARKGKKVTPTFIEVKYGDGALTGAAGIREHCKDMASFLGDKNRKCKVYEEITDVFKQKRCLCLIHDITSSPEIKIDDLADKPEFIFVFANHKPASTILKRELEAVISSEEYLELKELCDIKVATASFMGYGLYSDYMISIEEFVKCLT
jgi:hypothetical protein